MAAARPQVSVQKVAENDQDAQIALPAVLLAPIRTDIVHFVHTSMAKNRRQPYAVSPGAGHQHSAESWGTGRAVSRVPRVSGGGTSRAGQAAFTNQSRKGRMFAPTKTWRKWHRKINTNQKRYAVASALAASAVPALVQARGHRIHNAPEVPLVLSSSVESTKKTKDMIKVLQAVGAYDDVLKAARSKKLRAGKGKLRGRRHTSRRGPLIVYAKDNGIVQAARNLPGVELCQVSRLNLLQLAPGAHVGRFIVWTQGAFAALDKIWGSRTQKGNKRGYVLPANLMTTTDITRIINSDEVQSKIRPAIKTVTRARRHVNALTNAAQMIRLNPYAAVIKRQQFAARQTAARKDRINRVRKEAQAKRAKANKVHAPNKKQNYARLSAE